MAIYVYPPVSLSITSGPVAFVRDGSSVNVSKDTVTPANSRPLPTELLDANGAPVVLNDLATETTLEAARVLLASIAAEDFSTEATLEAARVILASLNGKDFATQATLAALLAELELKADLTETQPVKISQAQTGDFNEDLSVSTTPETFIAPANAFACFIEADDTNETNIRVKMGGGAASTTSGIQFQGGRSEFYQGGSNISYCTESGTGKLSVQWFVRS